MPDSDPVMLSSYAMATRFELVLPGEDRARLRAAGEEALDEIQRLDGQLSIYRPESDVSRINALAASGPVQVEPRLFALLQTAAELSAATDGAFDIAVAPLMRAWGLAGGEGRTPSDAELDAARTVSGISHVLLDARNSTVSFDSPGVALDLGAIGKGYAVECAVESLIHNGITSALLHGGTSSIHAIGAPPGQTAWRVAVGEPADPSVALQTVELRDLSLSVSAVSGKSFTQGGVEYGHVIDPRTGRPVSGIRLAAVVGPSATVCDALSTALLVLGEDGLALLDERFSGYRGLVH